MNTSLKVAVYTVCNSKFIPQALALFSSLGEEGFDFYIGCTDIQTTTINFGNREVNVIGPDTLLSSTGFEALRFRNIIELATTIKPFALEYLLKLEFQNVFYFDPDIFIYNKKFIYDLIHSDHSIAVTPHSLVAEKTFEEELKRIEYGIFNLGFLYVKNDTSGKKLAEWWKDRCKYDCYEDISTGIYTDQKFFDVVPCLFPNVLILRDPHLNLAYWNFDLHMPLIELSQISFVHWSSKDFDAPNIMSRKEISGGEKIVLDGLLLEMSKQYNTTIKTFSAETVLPSERLTDSFNYSNPVYSRLVSEGLIKFDPKVSHRGFGNSITARNFSMSFGYIFIRTAVRIVFKLGGVKALYHLSRGARYLGKSTNLIDMVFQKTQGPIK